MATFHPMPRRHQRRGGRALTATVAALALGALAACGSDDAADDAADVVDTADVADVADTAGAAASDVVNDVDATTDDLAQTLRDNGLESAASLVDQIDVDDVFSGEEFTFLAPDDSAFTTLEADETADLLTDPAQIIDVLRNHVLNETMTADDLAGVDSVDTEAGETLSVSVDGDTVTVGDVTVVATDIAFGDGVIHVVDGFLIP